MRLAIPMMLLTLLLTNSCFTPEYGAGGFLCSAGRCPEGYGCVCTDGQSRCEKNAADNPCNKPHDGGNPITDGPHLDDKHIPKGSIKCEGFREITEKVKLGAATFDMALAKDGTPVFGWIDEGGTLRAASMKGTSTGHLTGTPHAQSGIRTMALAINDADQLAVVFSRTASGGLPHTVWHDHVDLTKPPLAWVAVNKIPGLDVTDLDLAGHTGMTAAVYMAAAERPKSGSAMARIARIAYVGSKFQYTSLCAEPTKGLIDSPRITLGKHESKSHVGYSFYDSISKGWKLGVMKEDAAMTCPKLTDLKGVDRGSPAALGFDGHGGVQLAWGAAASNTNMGALFHYQWIPGKPIGTFTPLEGNTVNDAMSVNLAILGIQPCISLWHHISGVAKLHVRCKQGPSNWGNSNWVDVIVIASPSYLGYPTRIAVDGQQKIHLAYVMHKNNAGKEEISLRHTTCKASK